MTSDGPKATYQSPLRARLKEQTSQIILDAVGTVIRNGDLAAVSVAEVARVAEVTEQTVYRHYRSRDELIRAFVKWHLEQAVGGPDIKLPQTIDELLVWVEARYSAWEIDRQIVSETYLSAVGRELRKPLYELGYQNLLRMLGNEYPGLSDELRKSAASAMLTLMSTENFVFLQRNLGYDAKTVHLSVVAAINAMRRGLADESAATSG